MSKLVHNEGIKLFANWMNAISVAVVTAGVVAPFVSKLLNLDTDPADVDVTISFFVICICVGGVLHLAAQIVLGGLVDD